VALPAFGAFGGLLLAELKTRPLLERSPHACDPGRRRPRWTPLLLLLNPGILAGAGAAEVEAIKITTHSLLRQASAGKHYSFQFRRLGRGKGLDGQLIARVRTNGGEEGKLDPTGRLSGKTAGAACDAAACPEGWICGSAKRCEGIVTFFVSASNS